MSSRSFYEFRRRVLFGSVLLIHVTGLAFLPSLPGLGPSETPGPGPRAV